MRLLRKPDRGPAQPASLVAWWPADGDTVDAIGGNDAVLQNGTEFDTGISGKGFRFDGKDDCVVVKDASCLQANRELTISLSVKFDRVPSESEYEQSMALLEKKDDYLLMWRADLDCLNFTKTDARDMGYHLGALLPLPRLKPGVF